MDPGGIGKGYAVDRIFAMGAPPGEDGWHVEIKDPRDQSKSVEEVVLKDESMSTSGSYEKFFEADGHIYSPILWILVLVDCAWR